MACESWPWRNSTLSGWRAAFRAYAAYDAHCVTVCRVPFAAWHCAEEAQRPRCRERFAPSASSGSEVEEHKQGGGRSPVSPGVAAVPSWFFRSFRFVVLSPNPAGPGASAHRAGLCDRGLARGNPGYSSPVACFPWWDPSSDRHTVTPWFQGHESVRPFELPAAQLEIFSAVGAVA